MADPVVYSGFLSKDLQAWIDNVDLPEEARMRIQNMGETTTRHNVLSYDSWEAVLSLGTNKAYTPEGVTSDLRVIVGEIIGDGQIKIDGLDFDGMATVTGTIRGIGTALYPARVFYMGYNVTGITLVPLEPDVIFHVKQLVICEDGDPLYS